MKWDSLNEEFEPIDDYKYYVKRKYLMTEAEHNFFKVLQEVVKDRYYIVPQVQLSKIVEVNKYEKLKQKYLNKIDRKSVDFVLFDKEYFTPQIVIELDDSSHLLPKAEKNDLFKNKVLERVGIKLVRIKTAYKYDNDEILKATT
jgi:very-short-patch-repair endonuclease